MKLEESYITEIFNEVQWLHPIFYLIIILVSAAIWIISILQIIFKIPIGNHPASDNFLIIFFIIFGIIFPLIFLNIKLITVIRNDGIYIKFIPFHIKWQFFPFEKIEGAELIKYNPLKDYGGWGIRYGKKGKAYNAKGNLGIFLKFKDGKNLLIGTQKGEEFINILNQYLIH